MKYLLTVLQRCRKYINLMKNIWGWPMILKKMQIAAIQAFLRRDIFRRSTWC